MTTRAIKVVVISKSDRTAKKGCKVKLYGGDTVLTDEKGAAVFLTDKSEISIYVDGSTVYSGYAASIKGDLLVEK